MQTLLLNSAQDAHDKGLTTMCAFAVIFLAGGQARRMGMSAPTAGKALTPLGDQTLLHYALKRLAKNTRTSPLIALNVNTHPEAYTPFDLPLLADTVSGFQGPLAGVLTGMSWAAHQGCEAIITLAVDTPFFPLTLIEELTSAPITNPIRLAASHKEPSLEGIINSSKLQTHPTFGFWPVSLRHDLQSALSRGERKVSQWANAHGAAPIHFTHHKITTNGPLIDPFFNINTPQDLQTAEKIICSE